MTTAAPWSTSSSVSTVWMPRSLEVADDALVVDDLAEGMRRLAGGRGLLGLVDRLAHAVAEAGALRDPDLLDRSHVLDYRTGSGPDPVRAPVGRAYAPRCAAGSERGDAAHDQVASPAASAARRSRPGGSTSARRNGEPTRTVTRPPGMRQLLAARPARVRCRRCRPGRSARRSAARAPRRRPAPPGARRRGCACPPGTRTGRGPRRGSAWRAGRPRRRPRRGRPGGRRRARRSSRRPASRTARACRATGGAARARGMSDEPRTTHVEVRDVVRRR